MYLNKFNLNAYLRLNLKFCSLNCISGPYKFLMPEMICTLISSGRKQIKRKMDQHILSH